MDRLAIGRGDHGRREVRGLGFQQFGRASRRRGPFGNDLNLQGLGGSRIALKGCALMPRAWQDTASLPARSNSDRCFARASTSVPGHFARTDPVPGHSARAGLVHFSQLLLGHFSRSLLFARA